LSVYVLYSSDSEGSLNFFEEGATAAKALLKPDARLVWKVEAKSWEIACLKEHEFLGWEPYKPMISDPEDLKAFLPADKHDLDNFQLLENLGYPVIAPVLPELFKWLQDMNWPVAQKIAPFLARLGFACEPHIRKILDSGDGIWKYWVIGSVIGVMPVPEMKKFEPLLRSFLSSVSENDKTEEADLQASVVLKKISPPSEPPDFD
jgi:hypothetical protein